MKSVEQAHAEQVMGTTEECRSELWLNDVNDSSFFYCDMIPPMPDFPCMSASSSSSSTPAPLKANAGSSSTASSSSSAPSWAMIKSDAEEDKSEKKSYDDNFQVPASRTLSSTASMEIPQSSEHIEGVDDCMDVMENLSYIDQLLDSNDFFDPSSIFQQINDDQSVPEASFQQEQRRPKQGFEMETDRKDESGGEDGVRQDQTTEDLAAVFLEWLKTNRETVSAEDLRRVKIKKSTIECAARRLGGGREAMKQLLKLILEWVQTNQLQRRRLKESSAVNASPYNQLQNPNPNAPNLIHAPSDLNPNCFPQTPWTSPPAYAPDPRAVPTGFNQPVGYMVDPFATHNPYNQSPADSYNVMDCVQTWQQPQFPAVPHYGSFPENSFTGVPHQPTPSFAMYNNQYPYYQYPPQSDQQSDQRLAQVGSSATKEARKKRMARQRRFASHHQYRKNNHHHNINNSQDPNPNQATEFQARIGSENGGALTGQAGNWVYWQSVAGGTGMAPSQAMLGAEHAAPIMAAPVQAAVNYQPQQPMQEEYRRQGLMKTEKNLRFLLQKVLKQSDVGNLGRIVLPKKEAEMHLPELDARDGISIAMEDIGTSRVWNMRYRFWPNNKSRMYLLENTGEFVRANGLQEGDFIVIYSDVKCGKYLIRGVKVRQPGIMTTKLSETKRSAGKTQRNQQHSNSPPANNNNSNNDPSSQTLN